MQGPPDDLIGFDAKAGAERILRCAMVQFARQPFEMVTLSRIARDADVNVSLIKYHFRDKSGLYHAVLDGVMSFHEKYFRPYYEMWEAKRTLTKEEAAGILCMLVGTTMDGLYGNPFPPGSREKILLFEILYPSEYFDAYYRKYMERYDTFLAALVMAVTGSNDLATARMQVTAVFGLVASFRIEKEILTRGLGKTAFAREEVELMKSLALRNIFLLLESDLAEKYFHDFAYSRTVDSILDGEIFPGVPDEAADRFSIPDSSIESVERILEATTRLFSKRPVDAVSLETIAREAGVKVPLLMYHFKSKTNLYRVVFERVMGPYDERIRILADLWSNTTPRTTKKATECLSALVESILESIYIPAAPPDFSESMLFYECICPTELYPKFYHQYFRPHYEILVDLVSAVTGIKNRKWGLLQAVSLFGLMRSFRLHRESLVRSLDMTGFSREEVERIKSSTIRWILLMLEVRNGTE